MARARTLTSMITDVRRRADMVGDGHVTDAMLTDWLNQGLAELWDLLILQWPDRFYTTETITTSANTEAYLLPEDFYQIRGVDLVIQGQRIPMDPMTFQERVGPGTGGSLGYYGVPDMRYAVRQSVALGGMALYLDPPPRGTYTLLVHYCYAPTLLVAGGDEFDGVAGWEDYAVEYTRALALERQEQDSSPAHAAMARLRARINQMAGLVDASEQPVIANVRHSGNRRGRW